MRDKKQNPRFRPLSAIVVFFYLHLAANHKSKSHLWSQGTVLAVDEQKSTLDRRLKIAWLRVHNVSIFKISLVRCLGLQIVIIHCSN